VEPSYIAATEIVRRIRARGSYTMTRNLTGWPAAVVRAIEAALGGFVPPPV